MDGDSCRKTTKKVAKQAKPCKGNCNCKKEQVKKSEKTDCCNNEKFSIKNIFKGWFSKLHSIWSNLLLSTWICGTFQNDNGLLSNFLLAYNTYFLPPVGLSILVVFLLT